MDECDLPQTSATGGSGSILGQANLRVLAVMTRVVTILAGLILAAVLAHGAAWWVIGNMMMAGIDQPGPGGETTRHGGLARGGWPLRAAVTVERPEIDRPAEALAPAMSLIAQRAEVEAPLWSPRDVTVALTCPCRIAFPDTPVVAPIEVEASSLVTSFRAELAGPPRQWHLEGAGLVVAQGAEPVRIGAARVSGRRAEDQAGAREAVTFAFESVILGSGAELPFGREMKTVSGEIAVFGTMPPGPDPEASLRAWRDDHGQIELRRLALAWGPLALSAGLTLALDRELQPMGAGTIRLANWRPALDAVAAAGLIDRQATAIARLALAAASRSPPGGGPPVVEVPLALEDRTLTAARIPIARLPEIRWPRASGLSLGSR